MNHTTLTNFINNAEDIISNTISSNEITAIKAEEGSVVLMSGEQYNYLIGLLKSKYNTLEQ